MRSSASVYLAALLIGFFVLTMAGWSQTAWALDLQQAKSQGLGGEQLNGYLGIIKPSSEVHALVKRINQGRREYYSKIARRNGTSQEVVEVLAGKKAIQKTAAGQYIQNASGAWVSK